MKVLEILTRKVGASKNKNKLTILNMNISWFVTTLLLVFLLWFVNHYGKLMPDQCFMYELYGKVRAIEMLTFFPVSGFFLIYSLIYLVPVVKTKKDNTELTKKNEEDWKDNLVLGLKLLFLSFMFFLSFLLIFINS